MFTFLKQRSPIKKKSPLAKWRAWAAGRLRARGFKINLDICAYGKNHIVERVQPFGGGYVFWSSACNGCLMGQSLQKVFQITGTKLSTKHCALLEGGLLTKTKVEVNQVFQLEPRD
jgi:hypothetical protein